MSDTQARRGVAVLAVLVVVAIGALAGMVALLAARAAGEGASMSTGRVQSRLTMRSGLLVLEQVAGEQREAVLGGGEFDPRMPLEIFTDGQRAAVVRLDASMTPSAVSLDALLDVNTATADMLARLPGVGETLAAEIEAVLPVASIGQLLRAEGLTPGMLYGEYDESGILVSDTPPLASLLTVGSADPLLTAGAGGVEPGRARVRVDAERGEAFTSTLAQTLGEAAAQACAATLERLDSSPESRRALLESWRGQGVDASLWAAWLDAVGLSEGPSAGRVDINRAPIEVLAMLEGFEADGVAQRLVDARQGLPPEDLASVLWPLEQGLVDEEAMLAAVDRVTTRSVRWVLRAQAGTTVARERSVGVDSLEDARRIRAGTAAADEDRLHDRVAMDVLVDFSGPRPIVVSLGDVSIAGELSVVAQAMRAAGVGDDNSPTVDDAGALP